MISMIQPNCKKLYIILKDKEVVKEMFMLLGWNMELICWLLLLLRRKDWLMGLFVLGIRLIWRKLRRELRLHLLLGRLFFQELSKI
jgi:hypothetical protein